jgi:hypothetical protein
MAYSEHFERLRHGSEDRTRPVRKTQRLPDKELADDDVADMVRLIERKLAWYGFTSVTVGPYIRVEGCRVLVELIERGKVLCRLGLESGSTGYAGGQGLATLMYALRGERRRKVVEVNCAP